MGPVSYDNRQLKVHTTSQPPTLYAEFKVDQKDLTPKSKTHLVSGLVASEGGPLLAGVGEALRVARVPGEPGLGEDAVAVPRPGDKGPRLCKTNK